MIDRHWLASSILKYFNQSVRPTMRAGIVALGIIPLVLIASCSNESDSALLRIGILKHESSLPFYVAEEKGYFKSVGVQYQLVELPPGDHMPALLSGRVDVISPTSFPTLFGVLEQHPDSLYAVFPGAEVLNSEIVYGIVVKKEYQGTDLRALRSSVIMAINPFTQVNLRTIFSAAGIPENEWPEIRVVSREVALQAVISGAASAAIMDQPALAVALNSGEVRLLEANPRAKYIGNPYWSGAGAVRRSVWTSKKHTFESLLLAIDSSILFIRSSSDSAHTILARRLSLDASVAKQMGGYYFPLSNEYVPIDGIQKTVDALEIAGLLHRRVVVDSLFPPGKYR